MNDTDTTIMGGASEGAEHTESGVKLATVHVVHVNEAERVSFKVKITATLQQVWDKAYEEFNIPRGSNDIFQTGGNHPKSLMENLSLTLDQAKDQKVIENYQFGIASETGGA